MPDPETPAATPAAAPALRSRAGMNRTRAALLEAALVAIEKHGARRTTMSDIAGLANVAKGTLYNHFRSKDEVYAEAARHAVVTLGEQAAEVAAADGLTAALTHAAEAVASSTVLAALRSDQHAVLGAVVAAADSEVVRGAVADVLRAGGLADDSAATSLVAAWLTGLVAGASDAGTARAGAERLAAALVITRPAITLPEPSTEHVEPHALSAVASA